MFSVWILYCCLIYAYYSSIVKALPMNEESINPKGEIMIFREEFQSTTINNMDDKQIIGATENIPKVRVKRQGSGAGKFTEAAKMPQIKLLRLLLQMFKNSWDSAYIGGSHPFHPNVPKAIVALYKQKVVEFFIPDVGKDPNAT